MNVKPLKKSQVTITGTIDGVYKARQQLLVSTIFFLLYLLISNNSCVSEVTCFTHTGVKQLFL